MPATAAQAGEPGTVLLHGRIAELDDPAVFLNAAERADEAFETRGRLAQVLAMSPVMVRRPRWLNVSFACVALGVTLLAVAAADYVVRVAA